MTMNFDQNDDILNFNLPINESSLIKVIGVGGGGSNAVNHMFRQGIKGVDFIVCNTDAQSLNASPVPVKIPLGNRGLGAGSVPDVGRDAALESVDAIKEKLENNTEMVFITAGMGGGTGTGAAPVIASVARELGILTVGIVTIPFGFEGRKKLQFAQEGIANIKDKVDALLVICNDKLRDYYGSLKMTEAFAKADDVLATAAKSIAELITYVGSVNVDLEDVKTVMKDSGVAIMGAGTANGENRAIEAIQTALTSPLLNDNEIYGAKDILLNISSSAEHEVTMDEMTEITDYVSDSAGENVNVIWGLSSDDDLGESISITLIATGFDSINPAEAKPRVKQHTLGEVEQIHNDEFTVSVKSEESAPQEPMGGPVQQNPRTDLDFGGTQTVNQVQQVVSKDTNQAPNKVPNPYLDESPMSDLEKLSELRKMNSKIRTEAGVEEYENTPAFVRAGININIGSGSADELDFGFDIESKDDNGVEIKKNRFLHDNVV